MRPSGNSSVPSGAIPDETSSRGKRSCSSYLKCETVPLDGSPSALAVGGGSVWAASVPGDTVYRIDQATYRVTDRVPLPRDAHVEALAYGRGRLWVATEHQLLGYDPATDRPARASSTAARRPATS